MFDSRTVEQLRISMNWRCKPLTSHEGIVNLISSSTTRRGLKIKVDLDTRSYKKGINVTDDDLEKVNLEKADFHGEWNYTIIPKVNCLSG